jgi:NAD-dependent dihydropyrimidine dehydrogenase PreA subunit
MKTMRKIIKIDEEHCDGCGQCVPECAEGALQIVDGKARVVADKYCDGLGACIGECPNGALTIVEREAEEFDEAAVEAHLSKQEQTSSAETGTMACGCPSTQIQAFTPASCREANQPATFADKNSELTHWPVQIRLVPPSAPFLKKAHLLVTADCAPLAFPNIHSRFIKGKTVLMGCPKFDDVQDYIDRFAEIFSLADIRTVTALIMEVPCCSGLPAIIRKGMEKAGKNIPLETVVVSTRGKILESKKTAIK